MYAINKNRRLTIKSQYFFKKNYNWKPSHAKKTSWYKAFEVYIILKIINIILIKTDQNQYYFSQVSKLL